MPKKKSEHYVNNKELLEAMIVYRGKVAIAREKFIPYKDLVTELSSLEMLLSKNKEKETLEFLKELVKDWDTVEKVETNLS